MSDNIDRIRNEWIDQFDGLPPMGGGEPIHRYSTYAVWLEQRLARAEKDRDVAEEGRNLVVAELQRLQLEFGIRCVGGEPTRNFRVPQDRKGGEPAHWPGKMPTPGTCFWCAKPLPDGKVECEPMCGMPIPEPETGLDAIADAGDTREVNPAT